MSKKILVLILFLIIGLGLDGTIAQAQGDILPKASGETVCTASNVPAGVDPATYCGAYTLDDFVVAAVNISRWILGIVGSLSLVMFIYGGFVFLISAGSSDKIEKAKKIIIAAIVGLIIVFASWLIIRFVLQTLNPNINWTGEKIPISNFQ